MWFQCRLRSLRGLFFDAARGHIINKDTNIAHQKIENVGLVDKPKELERQLQQMQQELDARKDAKGKLQQQMLSQTARMEDTQAQLEAAGVSQLEDLQRQLVAQKTQMLDQHVSILQATAEVAQYRQCVEVITSCMQRVSLGTQAISQELSIARRHPAYIPDLADLLLA